VRHHCPASIYRAVQVPLDDEVEEFGTHLRRRSVSWPAGATAGVAHEDVNAPPVGGQIACRSGHGGRVTDICCQAQGSATQREDLRHGAVSSHAVLLALELTI
jgi:hypothetical protein